MRFEFSLNECPSVAFKYKYRWRMGSTVDTSRLFNEEIFKKSHIQLVSFSGLSTSS